MLGVIVTITVIYIMPVLPSFGELTTHTVDTSRCGVTCQWLHHIVRSSVCTQLSYVAIGSCEIFMQLHCTIQNKHQLISIDLTINSCSDFEFTIKTMNALLSEMFTHHQRVASTCYSQLQQLKDCTIFPIINYFLVKYHIFTFFSIHVHITTHNMSSYTVGYSLELEHTSCAQCQLK